MKKTLWTKNFTLVTAASALGAVGGIAGGFALSFLVFDETGSTLASALILAIQLVPFFVLPLFLAPVMDRLPRKPFLVAGDIVDGVLYALMGFYLIKFEFSYAAYLGYSLLLACLGSFDELAFQSIYPKLIPEGMEQQGYAVSTTLYPILRVIMLPLAGVLLDAVGAAWILIGQGGQNQLLHKLFDERAFSGPDRTDHADQDLAAGACTDLAADSRFQTFLFFQNALLPSPTAFSGLLRTMVFRNPQNMQQKSSSARGAFIV